MKKTISIAAVLFTLSLLLFQIPSAGAAENAPGDTVTIRFTFEDIHGLSGEFSYDNPDFISDDVTYSWDTKMEGDVTNDMPYFLAKNSSVPEDLTIVISFKISKNAQVGDQCVIRFDYDISDQFGDIKLSTTETRTVTVDILSHPTTEPTTKPTTKPTQPATKPTTPTQATTKPTTPPTQPTTQPTVPTQPTIQPTDPTQPAIPTQPTAPVQTPQDHVCSGYSESYVRTLITVMVCLGIIILLLIGIIAVLLIMLVSANAQKNKYKRNR